MKMKVIIHYINLADKVNKNDESVDVLFAKENIAKSDISPLKNTYLNARKKIKESAISYENSNEYRVLIQNFSSGVTLRELCSIAIILSTYVPGVKMPNRDEKRNYPLLIEWYCNNWELVCPMLPYINILDANKEIINGERELMDMRSKKFMKNA